MMLKGGITKKYLQLSRVVLTLIVLLAATPVSANQQYVNGALMSVTVGSINGGVELKGYASPGAMVTFLRNGSVTGTQIADKNSFFDETLDGLMPITYTFSMYAVAPDGRRTLTISFAVGVQTALTTTISGIVLPAVVTVPNSIKRTETLTESGLAQNGSSVTTFTDSIAMQTVADDQGEWSTTIDKTLDIGDHTVSALVSNSSGDQSIQTEGQTVTVKLAANLGHTNRVNLTDFSILMYNYGLTNPPNKAADINDDGKVDLTDFSIMMFYWTN